MMLHMDTPNSYTIRFDSNTTLSLFQMAENLGTTPDRVIAQALVLLKTVQGKKIILKEDKNPNSIEIKRYVK